MSGNNDGLLKSGADYGSSGARSGRLIAWRLAVWEVSVVDKFRTRKRFTRERRQFTILPHGHQVLRDFRGAPFLIRLVRYFCRESNQGVWITDEPVAWIVILKVEAADLLPMGTIPFRRASFCPFAGWGFFVRRHPILAC